VTGKIASEERKYKRHRSNEESAPQTSFLSSKSHEKCLMAKEKKKKKSKKSERENEEEEDDLDNDNLSVGAHKTPILCANILSKCIK
jgi:hypothetical protein